MGNYPEEGIRGLLPCIGRVAENQDGENHDEQSPKHAPSHMITWGRTIIGSHEKLQVAFENLLAAEAK